jgi:TolB-like protein/Tfp pilus assembly protein PilF
MVMRPSDLEIVRRNCTLELFDKVAAHQLRPLLAGLPVASSRSARFSKFSLILPSGCSEPPLPHRSLCSSLARRRLIAMSIPARAQKVHCSKVTDIAMDPATFLTELKRRKVYRVAVAYAIVAWLLIQAASILFPTFEAPPWVMKVFVTAVVLGFPVALILAWAFDLTPEGIRRSEEVASRESKTSKPGSKWTATIVAAAVLAAALLAFQFVRTRSATTELPKQTASTATLDKSVAVLPFENLSSDKENAFFAQGIQDEIITTLSKISGLRVISRTSTAHYNSAPENLPEIAQQLRVSHVLEGSVQKVGERVHINVQLIQAGTDAHLWAQSYDRQLTDIFSVEAEVAKSIADSLSATLSPQEKAQVEAKPTDNADAYVLYLRARDYQTRPDNLMQDFRSAMRLFEQAITLDPKFALAHARLATTTSNLYHFYEPTEPLKQKAHAEALESLRLQPNLGEGHLALGLYHYYMEGDYDAALRELDLAARALPNDGDVGLYTAAVERRRGHWTQALAAYEHAETVDPRNSVMLYDASQTYFGLRDWHTAAERMDRVLALFPDSFNVKIQRAYIEFFWKGSTAPIKAALETLPPNLDPDGVVTFARWDMSLMNRDVVAAEKALAACQLDTIASQTGVPLPKTYLQACIDLVRGDSAKAQAKFEAARPSIEKTVANSPQDGIRHAQLGLLYAFLGRKDDALREGQRAMELKPIAHDVIEGAVVEDFYTLSCARLGETDEAVRRIERLLTTPFAVDYADESITLSDLRQRWEWDPLRKDPRFQKILAGPEPKTLYN